MNVLLGMKRTFITMTILFMAFLSGQSQQSFVFKLDFNYTAGMSSNSYASKVHRTTMPFRINVENTSPRFVNYYNAGLTAFLDHNVGIKIFGGINSWAFNYKGESDETVATKFEGSYDVDFIELGLAYVRQYFYGNNKFLIESGIAFNTDASFRIQSDLPSGGLSMRHDVSINATFRFSYETPIFEDRIFMGIGINAKAALTNVASFTNNDGGIKYYPFNIGPNVSLSYNFSEVYRKIDERT